MNMIIPSCFLRKVYYEDYRENTKNGYFKNSSTIWIFLLRTCISNSSRYRFATNYNATLLIN